MCKLKRVREGARGELLTAAWPGDKPSGFLRLRSGQALRLRAHHFREAQLIFGASLRMTQEKGALHVET